MRPSKSVFLPNLQPIIEQNRNPCARTSTRVDLHSTPPPTAGKFLSSLREHSQPVLGVALACDGSAAVSVAQDTGVCLWWLNQGGSSPPHPLNLPRQPPLPQFFERIGFFVYFFRTARFKFPPI